jgi:serine protease
VPAGREAEYAQSLARQPGVRYAELNYLAQPQIIPNDPQYPVQWSLPAIQASQAWDFTRGLGATVAVVDTGVAFEDFGQFARSPELSRATFTSPWDFTENDPHPNDENGHGTHVTGTIAQDWNDGAGVAGIAPDADIMPIKVCTNSGCPGDFIASGIRWAVDHGADVINMSLGGPTMPNVEREALAYAEEQGVVVVAASGNGTAFIGGPLLHYPARYDTVIAVGALDFSNERVRYSNYGKHENGGGLLIMAPGGNTHVDQNGDGNPDGILQSTYVFACGGGQPDYTQFMGCFYQGTSMATPHVSGVVALLLARFPDLTPAEVREVIGCSVRDIGPPGEDEEYGSGIVQAATALQDNDWNGRPDCLDERPELRITVGGGTVEPGGRLTIPVAAITSRIIASYDILVRNDASAIEPIACYPREEATCVIKDDSVRITATDAQLQGSGSIAQITYEARNMGVSFLQPGASADIPDVFDPPVRVMTADGMVIVKDVPETIPGDVNCDTRVTTSDVTMSLGYSLGLRAAFCWRYGDLNCNGTLEGLDVLTMLDYLAGAIQALPSGCP